MTSTPLLKRKPGQAESSGEKQRPDVDVDEKAYLLCKEYLPGPWTQVSFNDFKVTPLGGGLTNKLYVCTLPTQYRSNDNECDYPTTVLLRLYGLILQDFKAQIQESVVFSILAERRVGPRLYAVFPNGRLEEFLPSRTLVTEDLKQPQTSAYIAERVAEYHRLDMPVKKDPTFIMAKLPKYLEKSKSARFEDAHKQSLLQKLWDLDISEEVTFLERMTSQMERVVVFCHNDVQEGNLLYSEDDSRGNPVQMIDFEYSSYNYRGFDIGNHFCEWTYDYSHGTWPFYSYNQENYPTEEEQRHFIAAYVESMHNAKPSLRNDDRWTIEFIIDEADRFVLLSHLFWALWSIRQAQISDIEFGYLEYALERMKAYFLHKQHLEGLGAFSYNQLKLV